MVINYRLAYSKELGMQGGRKGEGAGGERHSTTLTQHGVQFGYIINIWPTSLVPFAADISVYC